VVFPSPNSQIAETTPGPLPSEPVRLVKIGEKGKQPPKLILELKLGIGNGFTIILIDAESITHVVSSSKEFISAQLGYVEPTFKIYRTPKGNSENIEV
jgi:hypothetical protein